MSTPISIRCSPYVSHQDINAKADACSCSNCRQVIQKARLIITETEQWALKNLEITCYGDHFAYCFWSGNRSHEVTVQMIGGEIHVETNITSWTESLKSVVRRNWSKFVGAAFKVAGLLVDGFTGVGFLRGSLLKALTFK